MPMALAHACGPRLHRRLRPCRRNSSPFHESPVTSRSRNSGPIGEILLPVQLSTSNSQPPTIFRIFFLVPYPLSSFCRGGGLFFFTLLAPSLEGSDAKGPIPELVTRHGFAALRGVPFRFSNFGFPVFSFARSEIASETGGILLPVQLSTFNCQPLTGSSEEGRRPIQRRPTAGSTACLSRGLAGAAGAAASRRCVRRSQSPTC